MPPRAQHKWQRENTEHDRIAERRHYERPLRDRLIQMARVEHRVRVLPREIEHERQREYFEQLYRNGHAPSIASCSAVDRWGASCTIMGPLALINPDYHAPISLVTRSCCRSQLVCSYCTCAKHSRDLRNFWD